MKAPEVEVIRLNGFDVMTAHSQCEGYSCSQVCDGYQCSSHECDGNYASCTSNCGAVAGYCTECVDDWEGWD